jgi:hypothetical protein
MHLLKLDKPPEPPWEPDQGWRVLDPDGHVVNAVGRRADAVGETPQRSRLGGAALRGCACSRTR